MGFFGRNRGQRAAAQAESERLRTLAPLDLAAEVMAAFAPDGLEVKPGHRQGPMEVVSWLLPDASVKYRQPLLGPVIEALGALEHANLLSRRSFGNSGNSSTYNVTRRGTEALAGDTVREQLGNDAR